MLSNIFLSRVDRIIVQNVHGLGEKSFAMSMIFWSFIKVVIVRDLYIFSSCLRSKAFISGLPWSKCPKKKSCGFWTLP